MSAPAPPNTTAATDLAVILPEPITVQIPRASGEPEQLKIMPLPFRKWRQGFRYIAQIAPLFGFNLEETNLEQLEQSSGEMKIDKQTIFTAMQGEKAEIIYEFLAFAINKLKSDGTPDAAYFDDIYEQAIDIAVAVIKVNYNFFIQRLLPKLTNETKSLVADLKQPQLHLSTSGQPQ